MGMSRKQEIYKEFLRWSLPGIRNRLSMFRHIHFFMLFSRKQQRSWRCEYEVAEFVHNLYISILQEEWTDHDIHFLNYQARSFCEANNKDCSHYALFAYYIQELFKEVPEERRGDLRWDGPQGDYSWARPKFGWEFEN